ncbi:hypothetical protein Ddc_16585 [Ditylenchus destructor]|nr:hypothetical protein Ddc_16585 [Ditylenchus destructor]
MRSGTLLLPHGVELFQLSLVNDMPDRSVFVKIASSNKNLVYIANPLSLSELPLYIVEYSSNITLNVGISSNLKSEEVILNFIGIQTSTRDPNRITAIQKEGNQPEDALVFRLFASSTAPMAPSFKFTVKFAADGLHGVTAEEVKEGCGMTAAPRKPTA